MAPKKNLLALCEFLKGDGDPESAPIPKQDAPMKKPSSKFSLNSKKRPASVEESGSAFKRPAAAMAAEDETDSMNMDFYQKFSLHMDPSFSHV